MQQALKRMWHMEQLAPITDFVQRFSVCGTCDRTLAVGLIFQKILGFRFRFSSEYNRLQSPPQKSMFMNGKFLNKILP